MTNLEQKIFMHVVENVKEKNDDVTTFLFDIDNFFYDSMVDLGCVVECLREEMNKDDYDNFQKEIFVEAINLLILYLADIELEKKWIVI